MKKQILVLAMAFCIIGFSNVYAQLVPRAVDMTCLPSDALHPIPGSPYNYIINVPTPAGTKSYEWFVTQDQNFITAGGLTTTREAAGPGTHFAANGVGYNDPATGAATLSLTWNTFVHDPALPVFVVVQVKSTETGACDVNNLKVFQIQPVNAFTLDIANIKPDKSLEAYEATTNVCVSPIVSAKYEVASQSVVYDFGVNYLYYEVVAANFSTSWMPSLTISGLDAKETVTAVEWFRPTDATFATPVAMNLAAGVYTSASPVTVVGATGAVGAAGESIIIRVTIDHTVGATQSLNLADETIVVAVDGKTLLSAAPADQLGDVHFSSTVGVAADCGKADGFNNDKATQIIKARPDVVSATPVLVPAAGTGDFLPVK